MIKKWNQKNMKECDKRNSHKSSQLHMIHISSNNGRQPVIKFQHLSFAMDIIQHMIPVRDNVGQL
jgi:hypothetical protein